MPEHIYHIYEAKGEAPNWSRKAFADSGIVTGRCIGRAGASLALMVFFLAPLTVVGQERFDRSEQPPNVIVIMADDLGYGDVSAFQDGWIETPHLERLARGGMRLTDFHAGGTVCSPTRASLLTGRYPQRAGLSDVVYAARDRNRHHGLHQKEFTLAELARKAGHATGIVGKWHLGYRERYNPTHNGFDAFHGFVSGNVDYFSHVDGIGVRDWWKGAEKVRGEGYSTHLITEHAVQFITQHQDAPFFLYVAHEAPHWPYQGPGDEVIRKEGGARTRTPPRQTGDSTYVKQRYRQMVTEMDKGVGRILDALQQYGLAEQTLVLFFSDNGPKPYGSAGRLRGWKGSVFEGGHRVPAFAWWPSRIEPGSRTDELMITLDVLPTLADLIGRPPPEKLKIDGTSLLPALLDGQALGERALFWAWKGQAAMREGSWKLVRNALEVNTDEAPLSGLRLYNLAEDRGEAHNVAATYPERAQQMEAALQAWREEVARGATEQPSKTN